MIRLIDSSPEAQSLLDPMLAAEQVAFDLESDSYFRYRPSICTAQFSWSDGSDARLVLLDTMAIDPVVHLSAVLADTGPTKVIHDAGFDARLLYDHGITLDNVFDTSVAARFIGENALGLDKLLLKYLGVTVDKEHQLSDWGTRPLPQEQLHYLREDVINLVELKRCLLEIAESKGIVEEIREESRYLVAVAARAERPGKPPWARVRGHATLSAKAFAVLRELAEVREEWAERSNRPPFRIVPNAVLVVLSKQQPRSVKALQKKGRIRQFDLAEALFEAVQRGKAQTISEDQWNQLRNEAKKPPVDAQAKTLKKRLLGFRKKEAQGRAVDEQAILPGHCVADLVRTRPQTEEALAGIPGLGRCRQERYGTSLLRILGE